MKRLKYFSIFCIVLIFTIILVLSFKEIPNKTKHVVPTVDIKETISILKNNLPKQEDTKHEEITIEGHDTYWIINQEKYFLQKTKIVPSTTSLFWEVDLSVLSICGKSKGINLYSSSGNCDNDIIIATKNDEYYLLSKNKVALSFQTEQPLCLLY